MVLILVSMVENLQKREFELKRLYRLRIRECIAHRLRFIDLRRIVSANFWACKSMPQGGSG